MLKMRDNVGSNAASIDSETTMCPGIIGSTTVVRNLDLGTTITIKMPTLQLRGKLGVSIHAIMWSASSCGPLE